MFSEVWRPLFLSDSQRLRALTVDDLKAKWEQSCALCELWHSAVPMAIQMWITSVSYYSDFNFNNVPLLISAIIQMQPVKETAEKFSPDRNTTSACSPYQ